MSTTVRYDIPSSMKQDPHFTRLVSQYRSWPYKNTSFLLLSLLVFWFVAGSPWVDRLIGRVGELGYLGAAISGMLFVSVFTVAPAAAFLAQLADSLHPVEVALFAGLGAVLGDYLIFRFLRDQVFDEIKPLMLKFGGSYVTTLFRTPYFAWLMPVVGAIIVASPFPDEVGLGLMSASRLKNWQFLVVTFVLNAAGILVVVSLARVT